MNYDPDIFAPLLVPRETDKARLRRESRATRDHWEKYYADVRAIRGIDATTETSASHE